MPDVVCLDTNVLLYAAVGRKNEADKRNVAHELMARAGTILPAQTLAEFYSSVTGPKYRLDHQSANFWMARLTLFPSVVLDVPMIIEGVALSQRYRINYWDGAILAACHRCGANVLYSEDMSHDQVYGSVRVINPFLEL